MSLVSLACLKSDLFQEKIKVYILTAGQIHFPSPFALFFLVFQLHSFALLLKIAVEHQLKPVHVCHHQSFMKDTPWNLNLKLETECQCQFIMIKRNSCKELKKKKKGSNSEFASTIILVVMREHKRPAGFGVVALNVTLQEYFL